MDVQLPNYQRLWKQAKKENRRLRSQLEQESHDLAVARAQARQATARADALEVANDELRTDLASWMDKAVTSDG